MHSFILKKLIVHVLLIAVAAHASGQDRLQQMDRDLEAGLYPNMHSVLVFQDGRTVYEQYFNNYNADSLHDTRSAFKSITSLLIGIAIDKGLIKNVDQKVSSFFPEDTVFASDRLKSQMRIRDLLEMRSGFDCEEWNGTHDCESEMEKAQDWVKFSLALPMKNPPGAEWAYTSCATMILSGIIEKASGMPVMQFARAHLFSKLGITHYRWTVDPSGHGMTAGSFFIRPQDMLKIGQLVLNQGKWQGQQIVSRGWIQESTQAQILIPESSFVRSSRSKAAFPQEVYYGYQWYNEVIKTTSGMSFRTVFASGNGGQYILIIRQLKMVIVFTQGNYGNRTAKQAFDLVAKYILPSN
ncbi:serine hydrolase [Dyadobacter sp.]|uniref:serine hydrolase domain-containing protein n=1 Tax=Dyadobacter sp. TaxID=1914288 RepID=UPI0025BD9D1D|nr:serine hydrolase [Dyadobacter sp.]